jgi:hypothetical protein
MADHPERPKDLDKIKNTTERFLQEIAQQPGVQGADRMQLIKKAQQDAELAALSRVYPHRLVVMQYGVTTPECSVQLAERAQRLVDQEAKRAESTSQPEGATASGATY